MSGVNKLSGCDNSNRKLDIVFVHGIESNEHTAWGRQGEPDSYWPSWIANDFPDVGVWTIDYVANVSGWKGQSMAIADRGNAILDEMESDGFGGRPIVFIAHSLGGIIVKQLLRNADTLNVARWKKIADQTLGIVFIATPHAGSSLATFADFIGKVLRITETARELQSHDSRLRELHGWFRGFSDKRKLNCRAYAEKFEVRELLGQRLPKGLMVVDETSAEPNLSGEVAIYLDEDHISISKPKDRSASLYKGVRSFLEECLKGKSPNNSTSSNTDVLGSQSNAPSTSKSTLRTLYLQRALHNQGHHALVGRKLYDALKDASEKAILAHVVVSDADMPLVVPEFRDECITESDLNTFKPSAIYMEGGLFLNWGQEVRWRIERPLLTSLVRAGCVVIIADLDRNKLSQHKRHYRDAADFLGARAAYRSPGDDEEDDQAVYGHDTESCWRSPSRIVCRPENMLVSSWLRPIYKDISEILAEGPCELQGSEYVVSGNGRTTGTLRWDRWVERPDFCPFGVVQRHGLGYVVTIAAHVSHDEWLERCPDNTNWLVRLVTFLHEQSLEERARRQR